MTTKEQSLDLEALEAMVDRHSISGVVDMLSSICAEKSEHAMSAWQDAALAETWNRCGTALDECCSKLLDI